MAKSDSFFIRASTDYNGVTFAQSSVDLGAYVDALGKSVLRIHNISVQWGNEVVMAIPAGTHSMMFQLTTQSQTAIVAATDKSLISSGRLLYSDDVTAGQGSVTDMVDIAPQHWTNGYLVGVEQIYLGVDCSEATAAGFTACSIILECTVETLSSSAAMALALSQQ